MRTIKCPHCEKTILIQLEKGTDAVWLMAGEAMRIKCEWCGKHVDYCAEVKLFVSPEQQPQG